MSDSLGDLVVSFSANVDGLVSGAEIATGQFDRIGQAAVAMGSVLEGVAPYDAGNAVSDVDVAQAKLTLIEAKVAEARASLQELQGAADAGEAVTGIPEAQAKLTLLEADAQNARATLQELQQPIEMESAVEPGNQSLMGLAQNAYFGVLSLQGLAQTAIGLGDALTGPARTAEQTEVAFETLTGSTAKAKQEMSDLNAFAANTPFQTQAIDEAAEKLLAYGFNSKAVIPDITAIGDSLSALGKGSEANLSSIVDIFGKISAAGKLTGGDMMQLSSYGIPAWKMLSEAMGVPVDKLQQMVSKGLVPASTALDGLQKGMETTFGGGMVKQADTFNGQLSTLQSNATNAMAAFTGPTMQIAETGLGKLGALVASPSFQNFAKIMGQDLATALTDVGSGINKIIGFGASIVSFFQKNQVAAALLYGALAAVGVISLAFAVTTIPTLVVAFIGWATAAGAAAVATLAATWPILAIGAVIALVVAGIILAVQHWGQIIDWLKGVWGTIVTFFNDRVIFPLQIAFQVFGTAFQGIWDGVVGGFKGGINDIISGINGFISFIDSIQIHIPSIGVGPIHSPAFDWNGLGIPKIPYLASGGQVGAGAFIAGEQGPELIYTNGATVFNRGQTAGMLSGGQPQHIHIYLDGREVGSALVDSVGSAIVSLVRSQGPVGRVA